MVRGCNTSMRAWSGTSSQPCLVTVVLSALHCQFEDGTEFESSRKRGRAFQFKLGVGQVIEAWDIAISQMSKGQRARFTTPPELAYGVEGRPPVIPPNATLTFEVGHARTHIRQLVWRGSRCCLCVRLRVVPVVSRGGRVRELLLVVVWAGS